MSFLISQHTPRLLAPSTLPRLSRHYHHLLTPTSQIQRLCHSPLTIVSTKSLHSPRKTSTFHRRKFTMSSQEFSNTSTGDIPADPYKAKNLDDPSLEEKISTLNDFVSSCKFGMMTTWNAKSKLMASRCMAVAAKVHYTDPANPPSLSPPPHLHISLPSKITILSHLKSR